MRNHVRSSVESVLWYVGGVVILAAVATALATVVRTHLTGTPLLIVGVVIAILPAIFWLWTFYREDRLEPEPRWYVIGVFLLSLLLAQAVGQPLLRGFFHVQDWIGVEWVATILGSIFVVGLIQEFLQYAAVRYTVYTLPEFDQRIDGIIYGASAGLGYATLLNLQYVLSHGGVDLGVGTVRVAIVALAQGSFGGVLGYFLGRARFDAMGPFWLPAGLLLAAVLNGIVTVVLNELTRIGNFGFNPWYGLVAATLIAGVTFAILLRTMHTLNRAIGDGR